MLFHDGERFDDSYGIYELWVPGAADNEQRPWVNVCQLVSVRASVALELCELHAAGEGVGPNRKQLPQKDDLAALLRNWQGLCGCVFCSKSSVGF